jgi:hypothetical protein
MDSSLEVLNPEEEKTDTFFQVHVNVICPELHFQMFTNSGRFVNVVHAGTTLKAM